MRPRATPSCGNEFYLHERPGGTQGMVYSVFQIAYLNETTLTLLFHPNGEAFCTLNYMKENDQDLAKVKEFNLREAFGKGLPSQLSKI